jgi:hypothetical protein
MSVAFANEIPTTPHSFFFESLQQPRTVPVMAFANNIQADESSQYVPRPATYPVVLRALAAIAILLIVVGLIVGYALPGPITGLLLPVGLTLWFLVGHLARREDSK